MASHIIAVTGAGGSDLNPARTSTPPSQADIPAALDSPRPQSAFRDKNDLLPEVDYQDRLITRPQLSRWIGISEARLGIWGRRGEGPRPLRIGRTRIKYRIGDVLTWLNSRDAERHPRQRRTRAPHAERLNP